MPPTRHCKLLCPPQGWRLASFWLCILPLAGAGCRSVGGQRAEAAKAPNQANAMTNPNVTPVEAKRRIETQGYVYLDVRTVPEYEAGHPSGALNVPVVEPDASGKMV